VRSSLSRSGGKHRIARSLFAIGVVVVAIGIATVLVWQLGVPNPVRQKQSATSPPTSAKTRPVRDLTDAEASARCVVDVKRSESGRLVWPKSGGLKPHLVLHSTHGDLVVADQKYAWVCRLKTTDGVLAPVQAAPDHAVATDFSVSDGDRSDSPGELVWSGGALPRGVTAVTYRFPDGHQESAVTRDGYWVMEYASDTRMSVQPGRQSDGLPMAVTPTRPGRRQTLTVQWGDNCIRGRHGLGVAMGC
jgi:hypothetical protein